MPAQHIGRPMIGLPQRHSLSERLAVALYQGIRQKQVVREDILDVTQSRIKVVCISDTHNTKPDYVPVGDVLVHAGDLSQYGTFREIQAQLAWLETQPHPLKIVIGGNHDLLLDRDFVRAHPDRELEKQPGQCRADLDWGTLQYLEHEAREFKVDLAGASRRLSVFGSPWMPQCGSWAFQYRDADTFKHADSSEDVDSQIFSWRDAIPQDTDLVVVHGPPKGHLDDVGKGCASLLEELWRVRPKVVVCGHIHSGKGQEVLWYDCAQRQYDDVTCGKAAWIPLLCLAGLYCWIWSWWAVGWPVVLSRPDRWASTQLINASVVGRNGGDEDPFVTSL